MNSNEWGLTERGFRRPTYTELLDALEYKARELFGSKANLTVRSPIGLFLRIYAWILNMLFSTIEDVYNSRFVDTSVGTSLYNLGKAIGLRLLSEQKANGYLKITGTPGVTVPKGWLAGTVAGYQFVIVAAGDIGPGGTVTLPAQAVIAGPDGNAPAGTITTVINPGIPEGITAVTNEADFDGGRSRETDEEYRDRYYKSVDYAGGVNADAIRGEILQNVEGIYAAIVYENDTDEVDADGLPPHSVEAVVYGGLDGEVARQIFRRKAAGIQTYGSTSIPVLSESGATYTINFSRPTLVPVWVQITDLLTDDERFPADGEAQIKQAIINYIGGDATGGTTIGEDIYYNRLPAIVYTVPGVLDFELKTSEDGSTYGYGNVVIDSREKAVTDERKVSIA
ncbi:MAG: Baseplate J-like protein [Firmicutes bacterium ADurb.Bin506]|nr:MAG: Baseplate J-like protein [Firmicutes bacterium ADurb.Bin506]